ncbi:SDR family oxidoreductase [Acidicapsa dinghuensis]|uniref:SDR family oxidoreductase n=1 Tax=Acidicapsa dinghuensis TaxID=2218256 RepID=A0ABW1EJM7_9BACT|nr:SDR family oxidoreductase [Acidicapsa dinghuensis]
MILVTGATGKNGTELIKLLTAREIPLRAMVHSAEKSPKTYGPGIDYVVADFDDEPSLRRALGGIDRAFLVTPSSEKVEERQLRFVRLAAEAHVKHIVYLSQLDADSSSSLRFLRYHGVVEDAIRTSGMAFTMLRPNQYMQSLAAFKGTLASEGKIYAPIGDARLSIIDVRDIAAVAAEALSGPDLEGKSYDLTGPESLTHSEIAAHLSAALDKPIEFINITGDMLLNALVSQGFPEWQAAGIVEDYESYHRGEAAKISPAVKEVTDKESTSFAQFLADNKELFL